MPIDPNAFSNQLTNQPFNPLNAFAQMQQLQLMKQQGQENELALKYKQQQLEGLPAQQNALVAKEEEMTRKQKLENADRNLKLMGRLIDGVNDQPSLDMAVEIADKAGMDVSRYRGLTYSPQLKDMIRKGAIEASDQVTQALAKEKFESDKLAKVKDQEITVRGQDVSAQTAAAGQALTKRGQDLTNQRGIESNLIAKQNADNAGELKNLQKQELGLKVAQQQGGLQQSLADINNSISTIDRLGASPGLPGVVGVSLKGTLMPGYKKIPGTPEADFRADLAVLKSQAFLQAIQKMRGMGALSNMEGMKVEQAISSLDENQSETEFRKSLVRIKTGFVKLKGIVEQESAAAGGRTAVRTYNPQTGQLD